MSDRDHIGSLFEGPGRYFCPLISYQQQRQNLGLLFRELALAVRRSFPLHVVLGSIAASKRICPGARHLHPGSLLALIVLGGGLSLAGTVPLAIVVLIVGAMVLVFLSVRRHNDFVRYVANRLGASLMRGRTLSEAMHGMPFVFNPQERHTVIVGEQSGHLAEALETLAEYNAQAGRLSRLFAAILYPLAVLVFCLTIAGFLVTKILPKYWDIFRQIGGDLPALSERVLFGFTPPLYPIFILGVIAFPFLGLLIACTLVPRLVNGSIVATALFLVLVAAINIYEFLSLAVEFANSSNNFLSVLVAFGAAFGGSLAVTVLTYYLIRWTSTALPHIAQRMAAWLLGPFGPVRKAALSRFLLSLGYSLRARIPLPDALEMAGRAAGGKLRRDTERLRAVVEQGHSFAEAISSSPYFGGQVGAILSLSEWRGALADDCIDLAEQLYAEAQRATERLAALIEWPSIVFIGVVMGIFVVCLYLPLFQIPLLVR